MNFGLKRSGLYEIVGNKKESCLSIRPYQRGSLSHEKCRLSLIMLESSGIGQSDTEIVDHSDLSLYVMTPEFGAASQLEKIDMLDFADVIAINKAINGVLMML